jgi:O-antigen ligase
LIISWGLACLLLLLPLSDGGRTSFARAMLSAGIFCLISLALISRENLAFLRALPLRWLALVSLVTGASCLTSMYKDFSLREALTFLSVIGGSVLSFHIARQGRRRLLLIALLSSGMAVTLYALPSYLTAPPGSQAASALSGAFHYPNGLGSFLLLICFLPFMFVSHSGTRVGSLGAVLLFAVFWVGLILTHSRGVWAAGMIALVFWTSREWRLLWACRWRMAMGAVLIVSLVLIASRRPADIAPRFVSLSAATSKEQHDPSFQWRRDIYAWTFDIIKDRPWTGTGIGTFPFAIKLYQRAPYITGLYAHNHYLQVAAEMGLPALAGLLLALGFLFKRGWGLIASLEPGTRERSLAVGLVAGLLGSSLHAAVDLGWSYPAVGLIFGTEAAMLLGLSSRSLPVAAVNAQGPADLRALRFILLSLCLVMAALAGSRYYAEVFRNEGNVALEAGDHDRAVRAFRWSSRLNPLFYSPRQLLASAYAAKGDRESSEHEAEAAFRLDPFDGDAFHALARIHWLAGQHEKAESEFLSAVRLQPYTRLAYYYDLAEFYLGSGRPDEAHAWLRKGVEIFRPELVTSSLNRCLAPGDRYTLARMYWRLADISRDTGRNSEGRWAEEMSGRLSKPAMEEICFRGMKGRFLSPESTIAAYWEARSQRDWPGVVATFAREADQRFKDESLQSLPPDIEAVEVDWIVNLVGNQDVAKMGYELKLLLQDGRTRRAAFTDSLLVERGGWRLLDRKTGLK